MMSYYKKLSTQNTFLFQYCLIIVAATSLQPIKRFMFPGHKNIRNTEKNRYNVNKLVV